LRSHLLQSAFIITLLLCSFSPTWLYAQGVVPELVTDSKTGKVTVKRTPEDFSTVSLQGSELRLGEVITGDAEITPAFVREVDSVQWRANDPLDLWIIRPTGVKNPPVVLYLFSFPSDTEIFRNDALCKRLVANGTAAVGFVSALTGHRIRSGRPIKEWFVSELQESLATTVHDTQMVLNYLETRGDLDTTHVGMFGEGSGGTIALLSAAADPRIKAVDVVNPWGDWPDWLRDTKLIKDTEREGFLTQEFQKKLEPLEPALYLPRLSNRKLRIQYVQDRFPTAAAKLMRESMPSEAEIVTYKTTREFVPIASGSQIFQWISEKTKSAEAKHDAVQTTTAAHAAEDGGAKQ